MAAIALSVVLVPTLARASGAPAGDQLGLDLYATSLPGGGQPFALVATDLDGDGDVDLAVTNPNQDSVSIYLGHGDGTFDGPNDFRTANAPRGIVAGDFDRDGIPDIATAATNRGGVAVHKGLGDGRFGGARVFQTGKRPFLATAADLNGDGILDIAVANEKAKVSVLLGRGDGYFSVTSYVTNKWPSSVAAGDFNSDGHTDLAVTNWGANSVSVLFGTGDGKTFSAPRDFTYEGHSLYCVLAVDLDRDGHLDMVWNDIMRNGLYLLYGDGTGEFPRTALLPAGPGVRHAAAADLDGDGWLDLASADTAGSDVSIMLADGKGGFLPTQRFPVGVHPRTVAAADVNGDGLLDLIAANMLSNNITVLINGGRIRVPMLTDPGPQQTRDVLEFAGLEGPSGIAFHPSGDLLVSDRRHHRIARIAPASGAVSSFAGTGRPGDSGDGGAAAEAQLNFPAGLAVGPAGETYVADSANHRIRKVDRAGVITTVAGTGVAGSAGDGGPAVRAQLNQPAGVAADRDGNLYIADLGNGRIRRVSRNGTIKTVAAAAGGAIGPVSSLAVDPAGNLLIADSINRRIGKLDRSGKVLTLAGGGPSGRFADDIPITERDIGFPTAVASDDRGNVYFPTASGIVRMTPDGRVEPVVTVDRAGPPSQESRSPHRPLAPAGMAVDAQGTLYVADGSCNCIRVVDSTGAVRTIAGSAESEPAEEVPQAGIDDASAAAGRLVLDWEYKFRSGSDANAPYAVAVDHDGNVYVAGDVGSGADWRVLSLGADGKLLWQFNYASKTIELPAGLVLTPDGQVVAAGHAMGSNRRDYLVISLSKDGKENWRYQGAAQGDQIAWAIAADAASNLYVAGESEGKWEVFSLAPDGKLRWSQVAAAGTARAIAVDGNGDIVVAGNDAAGWRVAKLNAEGNVLWDRRERAPLPCAANGIAVDRGGAITVTGDWRERLSNVRVERLDSSGRPSWHYVERDGGGIGRSVSIDAAGNAVIVGETLEDWVMLSFDPGGRRLWRFTHDGGGGATNQDQAFAVAHHPAGGFVVAGLVHPRPPRPPSRGLVDWRVARYRVETSGDR